VVCLAGKTTISLSESVKKELEKDKEAIGAETWDQYFERRILNSDESEINPLKSQYDYTRSATEAFFDGLFESLKKHKDLIVELAYEISKALNPIPHAIANAITKITDAIIEKYRNGDISTSELFNLVIPLFEVYLQSSGKGSIVASLKALYVNASEKRFIGVSLDSQDTNKQSLTHSPHE